MSFGKIWKKQVQVPKGNVSIFKPKQGFELDDDKDKCCEEAKMQYKIWWSGSVEDYDKGMVGNGFADLSCDEFKEKLLKYSEEMGDDDMMKTLKIWKECENNV